MLAVAAGLAVLGQQRAVSGEPESAWPWLVAAALAGLVGLRLLERWLPADPLYAAPPAPASVAPRRRRGGLALLGVGGLLSLIAAGLLAVQPGAANAATSLWLLGVLAAAVGAFVLDGHGLGRPGWPGQYAWRRLGQRRQALRALIELGLLLAALGLTVWLRLPDLATVPANVHGDEADVGLLARNVLAGRMPLVFATAPAAEATALTFSLHAATMRVFGDNLFGLRLAAVIEGTLSVLLLYLLARRLWGARPALLAATFMAVAAWHIHFSRTGFHYMQGVDATLLALYFLVRAVAGRRLLDWLLCGFSIGLCIDVYYAARLAPVIAVVYLGYRLLRERGAFVRAHLAGLVALGFGALVFLGPMLTVYGRSDGSFSQRALAVLVSSPQNLQHELDAYHVSTLQEVLAIQVDHTLEAFNIRGETSLQYGHPAPLLDPWTGGLLAIGALGVLLRLGSASGLLLAAWVWLTLFVGSVLTVDALFSPRVLAALPGLVLGPALLLEATWRGIGTLAGRRGTLAFGALVLVVLGLALQSNVHDYFDVQVTERAPADRFTLLAAYAQTLQDRYRLYTIGRDDWTLRYETPRFLVPNVDAVDVRNASLPLPLDRVPPDKGVAFLVENPAPDFAQRMQAIQQAYPHGREQVVSERPGSPVFTIYLVDPPDLQAANPGAKRE
jgi:4-amino-4-deoxy-L-arabinose transferase-like glycosyltransferase